MKVREIHRLIDISLHSKHGALQTFSIKLIIILQKSLSYLSFVWAESTDFILNEGVNGAIENYRYLRVFVVFVLTDADERLQGHRQKLFTPRLPNTTGCNKWPHLLLNLLLGNNLVNNKIFTARMFKDGNTHVLVCDLNSECLVLMDK